MSNLSDILDELERETESQKPVAPPEKRSELGRTLVDMASIPTAAIDIPLHLAGGILGTVGGLAESAFSGAPEPIRKVLATPYGWLKEGGEYLAGSSPGTFLPRTVVEAFTGDKIAPEETLSSSVERAGMHLLEAPLPHTALVSGIETAKEEAAKQPSNPYMAGFGGFVKGLFKPLGLALKELFTAGPALKESQDFENIFQGTVNNTREILLAQYLNSGIQQEQAERLAEENAHTIVGALRLVASAGAERALPKVKTALKEAIKGSMAPVYGKPNEYAFNRELAALDEAMQEQIDSIRNSIVPEGRVDLLQEQQMRQAGLKTETPVNPAFEHQGLQVRAETPAPIAPRSPEKLPVNSLMEEASPRERAAQLETPRQSLTEVLDSLEQEEAALPLDPELKFASGIIEAEQKIADIRRQRQAQPTDYSGPERRAVVREDPDATQERSPQREQAVLEENKAANDLYSWARYKEAEYRNVPREGELSRLPKTVQEWVEFARENNIDTTGWKEKANAIDDQPYEAVQPIPEMPALDKAFRKARTEGEAQGRQEVDFEKQLQEKLKEAQRKEKIDGLRTKIRLELGKDLDNRIRREQELDLSRADLEKRFALEEKEMQRALQKEKEAALRNKIRDEFEQEYNNKQAQNARREVEAKQAAIELQDRFSLKEAREAEGAKKWEEALREHLPEEAFKVEVEPAGVEMPALQAAIDRVPGEITGADIAVLEEWHAKLERTVEGLRRDVTNRPELPSQEVANLEREQLIAEQRAKEAKEVLDYQKEQHANQELGEEYVGRREGGAEKIGVGERRGGRFSEPTITKGAKPQTAEPSLVDRLIEALKGKDKGTKLYSLGPDLIFDHLGRLADAGMILAKEVGKAVRAIIEKVGKITHEEYRAIVDSFSPSKEERAKLLSVLDEAEPPEMTPEEFEASMKGEAGDIQKEPRAPSYMTKESVINQYKQWLLNQEIRDTPMSRNRFFEELYYGGGHEDLAIDALASLSEPKKPHWWPEKVNYTGEDVLSQERESNMPAEYDDLADPSKPMVARGVPDATPPRLVRRAKGIHFTPEGEIPPSKPTEPPLELKGERPLAETQAQRMARRAQEIQRQEQNWKEPKPAAEILPKTEKPLELQADDPRIAEAQRLAGAIEAATGKKITLEEALRYVEPEEPVAQPKPPKLTRQELKSLKDQLKEAFAPAEEWESAMPETTPEVQRIMDIVEETTGRKISLKDAKEIAEATKQKPVSSPSQETAPVAEGPRAATKPGKYKRQQGMGANLLYREKMRQRQATREANRAGSSEPPQPPRPPISPAPGQPDREPIREPRLTVPAAEAIKRQALAGLADLYRRATDEPTKILSQLIGDAIEAGTLEINEPLLIESGVTPEQLASYVRELYHKWGHQGKQLSDVSKALHRLAQNNPLVEQALASAGKYVKALQPYEKFNRKLRVLADIWRASLIALPRTAMRNLKGFGLVQLVRSFDETIARAMSHLSGDKLAGNIPKELGYRVVNSLRALTPEGYSQIHAILKQFEISSAVSGKTKNKFESKLYGDITGDAMYSNRYIQLLTILNSMQEKVTRTAEFQVQLRAEMRTEGLDPAVMDRQIAAGEVPNVPAHIVEHAINKALEATFSARPPEGTFAHSALDFFHRNPAMYFAMPFPRFLYNGWRYTLDHNPVSFARLIFNHGKAELDKLSPEARDSLLSKHSGQDLAGLSRGQKNALLEQYIAPILAEMDAVKKTSIFSQAMAGSAMLMAAVAFRQSKYAGQKWNEYYDGEEKKYEDLKSYSPFSQQLFLAELVSTAAESWKATNKRPDKRTILDEFARRNNITPEDWTNFLFGITRTSEGAKLIGQILTPGMVRDVGDLQDMMVKLVDGIMGGYTNPAEWFRDFQKIAADSDDFPIPETMVESPLELKKARQHLPEFLQGYAPGEEPQSMISIFTGKPVYNEDPLASVFGKIKKTKAPLQEQMDELGLPWIPFIPRTGVIQADRLLQKYMGEVVYAAAPMILNSEAYNRPGEADLEFKRTIIRKFMEKARQSATKRLEREQPALYLKLRTKTLGRDEAEILGIERE